MHPPRAPPTPEDCCACFGASALPLRPCGHWMCGACADRWFAHGHVSCPLCRGVLVAHPAPAAPPLGAGCVWIDYAAPGDPARREHIGVTLASCVGGVRVRQTHPADRARVAGVRVGDVYTHLNGIPVQDHHLAIAIADRAAMCKEVVACRVAPRTPLHRQRWPWRWTTAALRRRARPAAVPRVIVSVTSPR